MICASKRATTPIAFVKAFFSFHRDHTIGARAFAQWAGAHVSDFREQPS
ncbi:hypothetical protein [Nonomuraea sp. SBT364]|nr:hypothetical protein [Nonomuraea sp. SBT364]